MSNNDWPDRELCSAILHYINKHCMKQEEWKFTRINDLHSELIELIELDVSEIIIVSCYISSKSWYILTSRRVVAYNEGGDINIYSFRVKSESSGNFKGWGDQKLEKFFLDIQENRVGYIECETGFASIASIYYFRFWNLKFSAQYRDVTIPSHWL